MQRKRGTGNMKCVFARSPGYARPRDTSDAFFTRRQSGGDDAQSSGWSAMLIASCPARPINLALLTELEMAGCSRSRTLVCGLAVASPRRARSDAPYRSWAKGICKVAVRQSGHRTARNVWSAWGLHPLSNRPALSDSASKLDALQTLRVAVYAEPVTADFSSCHPN
jgi:hypothetical protein